MSTLQYQNPPNNEQSIEEWLSTHNPTPCKQNYHQRFNGLIKQEKERLDAIIKEAYPYAIMASNAYDEKTQVQLPGWNRVNRITTNNDFSADLYQSENKAALAIAFRGTDSLRDFTQANLMIEFDSQLKGQYNDAEELVKKIKSDYPDKKILVIGHSLGGGLAIHISLLNKGIDAYTFNTSPRVFATKGYDYTNNRVILIHESGEILNIFRRSFFTLYKTKHEDYQLNFLGGNAAAEHSIEPLARCMTQCAKDLG